VHETIKELAGKGYALILVTESCTVGLEETLASFNAQPYPIILPIPDGVSTKGIGHAQIDANIKKVSRKGGNT
jgi:vacuolar-type H+-ATPase subunit F/Vma7